MFDVFDTSVCELTEQEHEGDDPIDCTESAIHTVSSGDLKGTHVCIAHSLRLRDDGYEIINELVQEDE